MSNFETLKQELFQKSTDKKYKDELLINIFLKDSAFVKKMIKNEECSQEGLKFLEDNIQKLTYISEHVSIPFFRNIKYEELLHEYCEKKIKTNVEISKFDNQIDIHKNFSEIASDTKEWLLNNWNIDTHIIISYLIDATKTEKIVWIESKSGLSFKIVLDDTHIIKIRHQKLVKKNDEKKQQNTISKEEFNRLYAAIKKVEINNFNNQIKTYKNFSGEITSDEKEWLLNNWNIDTHIIISYLIDTTKTEKIVWIESESGNSFKILLDDIHIIQIKRRIKNQSITFYFIRKTDGKNQRTIISKEEFYRLYAAIKKIDYREEIKILELSEKNNIAKTETSVKTIEVIKELDKFLDAKSIQQTNSQTIEWFLLNWSTSPKIFIKYLIDETRAGNVVWSDNLSSNSFNVVWNTDRIISVEYFVDKYYLTRKKQKKIIKSTITKNDFDRLYAAIKNETYIDDKNLNPVKEINVSKEDYVIENIDSFIRFVVNKTKVGNIDWNEFMDGNTFTAKVGSNNVITLIRSKRGKNFTYQVITESVNYKRKKDFGNTDPYGLYSTIQKTTHQKHYNTVKELSKYSQLISWVDKVNIDTDLEKLYKLTTRIQRNDEKCEYLIDRTYSDNLVWRRVVQSGITDGIYIASDNENNYLLRCYKEDGNILYRLYKNTEYIPNSGISRYLEVVIKNKNPKNVTDTNISAYCPDEILQYIKKDNALKPNVLPKKRKVNIGIKDLIVRRNIFKCMYNKHFIEDIDAIVKVMNKNIEIEEVVVLAGYCKQCNIFFILESTYQQLLKKGIVAFRTVDEKNYLTQSYLNGKLLAQESILMQFGYTVSQAEGLSEERRHKILSVLVDNHILTKSEIISYLDFFISQRKSDKFALAVAKWTIDRNYIRNYKIGEYSRIGVVYKNDF